MLQTLAIGKQSFVEIRENNCFYVDKTKFIKDWWNSQDDVTLITRPRRFGKTLMLDTVKTFFSPEFAGRSDLFAGLEIWKDEKLRNLQGKIPVIFLSFADIKSNNYNKTIKLINNRLTRIYNRFSELLDLNKLLDTERKQFKSVDFSMDEAIAQDALLCLSEYLVHQNYPKPIILLDEYDTPLQEAWLNGYWDELVGFIRGFFNATFKSNPFLKSAIITGITRIAKESIFSDMNNLKVVSVTSDFYNDCFGFTEKEVFTAMDKYGLTNKSEVKQWYNGFAFGTHKEIYNPWSIINFLSTKKLDTYWVDTTTDALTSNLLAHSNATVKEEAEILLQGKSINVKLDEQIVFDQLYTKQGAIWSLFMASGYVKALEVKRLQKEYKIEITNLEAKTILENKISEWFEELNPNINSTFLQALLEDNIDEMNEIMSEITESNFSYFDTQSAAKNDRKTAENFYHGFVLGLLIGLKDRYNIVSNRESGFGRYDICMYPKSINEHGIIIEFKSIRLNKEKNLKEACINALKQIKEKNYIKDLVIHNIDKKNIYIYSFAFQGKKVLICGGAYEKIDIEYLLDTIK